MGISYKVLVVDDELMMRHLLVSLLSQYGHTCEMAEDGIQALEKVGRNSFDSVVTDLVMPGMDGITLMKEMLKLHADLPIMVVTGYDGCSAEEALAAGAREFIRKPFSIDEFIIRFNKMMREHKEEGVLLTLSLMDELTGLYNRRKFFILAEQCLKAALRAKKRLLLLYIDLDDLKSTNDRFGHSEGDIALRDFAGILVNTFRESDIIARIGGDEFVVLLECDDRSHKILQARLHENIRRYNANGFRRHMLSISLGAAQFDPEHPIRIDELLSKADLLMYAQKRRRTKESPAFSVLHY